MNSLSLGQINGLFHSPVLLSSLVDELSQGLIIMDVDRRIMFLNRSFELLTGFDRDEVWNLPCRDVLRTNICHQKCPVIKTRKSNTPVTFDCNIINKEHQKIPVRITAVPLHDIKGNIVGFLETVEDIRGLQQLDGHIQQIDGFDQIIGRSSKMQELFRLIPVIAQTDSSVLITGETGTGKDVIAEVIHKASDRSTGPFIKINCGALPETLLESELFGHKKGAFTGAVGDKLGRLRLAHNGTLYLTEIGDLSLPLQVKLLTFLDDKIVYPLGSTSGFQAEVRIIAATHRNLEKMVKEGLFRHDLLFRLNVVRLHLPPLRDREGDINLLLDHFLKIFCARFGKKGKKLSPKVRHILLSYAYPGNVRELRNIVEYATNICQSGLIEMEHLPPYLEEGSITTHEDDVLESEIPFRPEHKTQEQTAEMNWAAIERQLIVDTLLRVNGRRSKAAEILGWGRTTLWRKMKQYGLES